MLVSVGLVTPESLLDNRSVNNRPVAFEVPSPSSATGHGTAETISPACVCHTPGVTFTDTQEQILNAAMDIIVRDGLEETSMRAVAEEADVSLGLLSYHFDDKENLILSAFRRASDRLMEVTEEHIAAAGDDPGERVSAAVRAFIDPEFRDLDHFAIWLAIWAAARTNDEIAETERELHERAVEQLLAAIRAACPEISAEKAQDRTMDVMALQNGLWINYSRWGDEDALERGLARCEAIALGATA